MTDHSAEPRARAAELPPEIRRNSPRHPLTAMVMLDRGYGSTRDISMSGVYFEAKDIFLDSRKLSFDILLPSVFGEVLRLKCHGDVVRVEPAKDRVGVAVRFDSCPFEDSILIEPAEPFAELEPLHSDA